MQLETRREIEGDDAPDELWRLCAGDKRGSARRSLLLYLSYHDRFTDASSAILYIAHLRLHLHVAPQTSSSSNSSRIKPPLRVTRSVAST